MRKQQSMTLFSQVARRVMIAGVAGAMALSMTGVAAGSAYAATETPFGTAATATPSPTGITTYGVRAGSYGPDFLGITNTNFDFSQGGANLTTQFPYLSSNGETGYSLSSERQLASLAIWGTSVNEAVNPYYANLLMHAISSPEQTYANEATTWMKNESTSSWGDSFGAASHKGNVDTGAATINGLEHDPDIIFGANKDTNWNLDPTGSNSGTYIHDYLYADENNDGVRDNEPNYNPTFVNNDATNIWTQMETIDNLAEVADNMKTADNGLTTRYDNNSAAATATAYQNVIKGQQRYIASCIDDNPQIRKTVAYLYAIEDNGSDGATAYFFTPTAAGLLNGDDTGKASGNSIENPDDNYAANNSTINMGYMATLPFITDTFTTNDTLSITMRVEDIAKANPACRVTSDDTNALAGVDVIIYNSTTQTNLDGTSGGKNKSGIDNDYYSTTSSSNSVLNDTRVLEWASDHGFTGTVIAGDDFGTSSNQGTDIVTAPELGCKRNYTCDKNARAAWAFAQVYPELYSNNKNATYAYWVNEIYHVNASDVPTVVAYMTHQNANDVDYTAGRGTNTTRSMILANATTGANWWNGLDENDDWSNFAYYTGSSRASYYASDATAQAAAEESGNTIGIFA